jgi:hypothetical protein
MAILARFKKTGLDTPVAIDYPIENEMVFSGHYAIRISCPQNTSVEVSIDGGPWQACRQSNGYFWFDWWPEKGGVHNISARPAGLNKKKAPVRTCTVSEPHKN